VKPSQILEKYASEVTLFDFKIRELTGFLNKPVCIRNESMKKENELNYVIELIKPDSENEDDYGIDIDFSIKIKNEILLIEIDVLKSYGPLYFSKTFIVEGGNDEIDDHSLNESIEWIKNLPAQVVKTYVDDYSG